MKEIVITVGSEDRSGVILKIKLFVFKKKKWFVVLLMLIGKKKM